MAGRAPKAGVRRRPTASVAGGGELFGPGELELLSVVLPEVEQLVGEHFRLGSFDGSGRHYDLVTLAGAAPEGVAPAALAKLCRFDRTERPISDGGVVSRFYRVYLQDGNLLARSREPGLSLRSLLRYVLAHELVHVVRFESFQVHYGAEGPAREREEGRVHAITAELLARLRDPEVTRVVEVLSRGGVDVLETRG